MIGDKHCGHNNPSQFQSTVKSITLILYSDVITGPFDYGFTIVSSVGKLCKMHCLLLQIHMDSECGGQEDAQTPAKNNESGIGGFERCRIELSSWSMALYNEYLVQ